MPGLDPLPPVVGVSYRVGCCQSEQKRMIQVRTGEALRHSERIRIGFLARNMLAVGFVVSLSGCGIGCLYHERGKVVVPSGNAPVSSERFAEVVRDALTPFGFAESLPPNLSPKPDWIWDYEFHSPKSGKFFQSPPVYILLTYSDLSIVLSDWSRSSKASDLDRDITSAIESAFRSELGADIHFVHPKPPPFCLGP